MLKEFMAKLAPVDKNTANKKKAANKAFANWLLNQMHRNGWNQSELARRADVTPTAIHDVLTGRRAPGWELCNALAGALNVAPEVVFRAAGKMPPAPEGTEMGETNRALFGQLSEESKRKALEYMEFLKVSEEKGEYRIEESKPSPKQAAA